MGNSRVVVVTGGGSGLGRAMVLSLVGAGHRVVLAGRRREALVETAALAGAAATERGAGAPEPYVVPTDVTRPEEVSALFEATIERHGRVDVLVNNAGGMAWPGAVDEVTPDQWTDAVAVNLTGYFLCAREAMARMRSQEPRGGRIVNNGSIAAHVPRPRSVAYTTTKHAITGLTRSIELDGRAVGVRCTQIDIGNAATDMTAGFAAGRGTAQADGSVRVEPTFDPVHVGELVAYVVGLPLEVTMPFVSILAAEMPYIGRG